MGWRGCCGGELTVNLQIKKLFVHFVLTRVNMGIKRNIKKYLLNLPSKFENLDHFLVILKEGFVGTSGKQLLTDQPVFILFLLVMP